MSSRSTKSPEDKPETPQSEYELVEAYKAAFERFDRVHMSTPAKAKATLQREGILAADGTLSKNYRD